MQMRVLLYAVLIIIYSTFNLFSQGLDIPENVLNDINLASDKANPIIKHDDKGNLHMFLTEHCNESDGHNANITRNKVCYYRYDYPEYKQTTSYCYKGKMGACDFDFIPTPNIGMYITENGYVFCTFETDPDYLLIFNDRGELLDKIILGVVLSGHTFLSLDSRFTYIPYLPIKESFLKAVDTAGQFSQIGIKEDKQIVINYSTPPVFLFEVEVGQLIGITYRTEKYDMQKNKYIDYGHNLKVFKYDLEQEKHWDQRTIELDHNPQIQTFNTKPSHLYAFVDSDSLIKVLGFKKDENDQNQFISFTMDKDLNLIDSPKLEICTSEKADLKPSDYQKINVRFIRTSRPNFGYFKSFYLDGNKLYISESREIPYCETK